MQQTAILQSEQLNTEYFYNIDLNNKKVEAHNKAKKVRAKTMTSFAQHLDDQRKSIYGVYGLNVWKKDVNKNEFWSFGVKNLLNSANKLGKIGEGADMGI